MSHENPYEPPGEVAPPSTEHPPLLKVFKIAWLTVMMFPTLFFASTFIAVAVGIWVFPPGSGGLVYVVPMLSLLAAGLIVGCSPASNATKFGWFILSVVAMVAQFLFDILVFGILALAMGGMSGVH